MTTALTVYERMNDPIQAIQVLGNAIAKSGMFGCGTVEGGQVFAMECLARRMPPLMLAERYHVIFGKLSMKAEAMLAGFEAEGGKYTVLSRTPDLVSVEMTVNGVPHVLSLSWEDAQKEPFVYEGKEDAVVKMLLAGKQPAFKPKYATPRSRMQMMWARLVSDGVRFLCPKVVAGVYTPEEISDLEDDNPTAHANGNGAAAASKSPSVVDQAEAAAKAAAIDVPFEAAKPGNATATEGQGPAGSQVNVATATPPAGSESAAASTVPFDDQPVTGQPGKITRRQLAKLDELTAGLNCSDKIAKALATRGLGSRREFDSADVQKIIDTLQGHFDKLQVANSQQIDKAAGSTSGAAGGAVQVPPATPCTQEQVDAIKALLRVAVQTVPTIIADVTKGIAAAGKKTFAELSARDAADLYAAIQKKEIDSFFARSLEAWEPPSVAEKSAAASQPAAAATATPAATPTTPAKESTTAA